MARAKNEGARCGKAIVFQGTKGHLWAISDFHSLVADLRSVSWPEISEGTQISQSFDHLMERRRAIRYRMSTSVIFHWKGPDNERFQGEGVTRDMSVASAFILTATCPPAKALVRIEVLLPLSDGGSRARMNADMMVLRVEHNLAGDKRSGFSAVGKGFSLRTFSKQASRLVADLIKDPEETVKGNE
jgi:hypothetical protein